MKNVSETWNHLTKWMKKKNQKGGERFGNHQMNPEACIVTGRLSCGKWK
jgi:hypothetical protein